MRTDTLESRFDDGQLTSVQRSGETWIIEVTYDTRSHVCPRCESSLALHGWVRNRSPYVDSPIEGHAVKIHVTRPRLKCHICKRTLTPIVPGLDDNHRVTHRLLAFLPTALWGAKSLRSFSKSIGASPTLLRSLLVKLAQKNQTTALALKKVGVHEFQIGTRVHLLVSNVEVGSVIAFFPEGNNQHGSLIKFLDRTITHREDTTIVLPANHALFSAAGDLLTPCKLAFSTNSLSIFAATTLAPKARQWSRKGRVGSVSVRNALEISRLHYGDLPPEHQQRYHDGIRVGDIFWTAFAAKERLSEAITKGDSDLWFGSLVQWFKDLSADQRVTFSPVILVARDIHQLGVDANFNPALNKLENDLLKLEQLLVRPGMRFSDEMIAALFLSCGLNRVPVPREFGWKRAGPLWLEEEDEIEPTILFSHAGTQLDTLIIILSVYALAWEEGALRTNPGPDPGSEVCSTCDRPMDMTNPHSTGTQEIAAVIWGCGGASQEDSLDASLIEVRCSECDTRNT